MKAAVYHKFHGPISIENVPKPKPKPDEVLLQVRATGVCRSDWHGWRGHDSDIVDHGLPFIPGHELSGTVVQVGSNVTKFGIGDRVAVPFILSCGSCRECCRCENRPTVCEDQKQPGFTMMGSFAEFVSLPRADRNLCLIPEGVSFVEAAALGCRFTTAYRAVVQQGGIMSRRPSDGLVIAIFGCGGLGLSCIMIASCYGVSKIIAVDVSKAALNKAREVGAHSVIDASSFDEKGLRNAVLELTDGVGAEVTIDAAGFASTCENAIWCTRRGGRMVQVGLPLGEEKYPKVPMGLVVGRELEIFGSHGFAASDLPKILKLVEDGRLDPKKLVEREVTLEEGARAIERMDKGSPLGITMITSFSNHSRL